MLCVNYHETSNRKSETNDSQVSEHVMSCKIIVRNVISQELKAIVRPVQSFLIDFFFISLFPDHSLIISHRALVAAGLHRRQRGLVAV